MGNEVDVKIELTKEELQGLIGETVKSTLLNIGIDACDPMEMRKDMMALRGYRQSTDIVKRQGLIAVVGIATVGLLSVLYVGFRDIFTQ